jgi:hypothetical protein
MICLPSRSIQAITVSCYYACETASPAFRTWLSRCEANVSTLSIPLPRKITPDVLDQIKGGRVNAHCCKIWKRGRKRGRQDTFIGLIDSTDWTFYLAPCFGVDADVVDGGSKEEKIDNAANGDFPDNSDVKSNSTSSSDASMVISKKSDLDSAYGKGNVCYVVLDPEKGFDGTSHRTLYRWIECSAKQLACSGNVEWRKLLGFAIQKDKAGYYIRYASTLNEHPGQFYAGNTFVPKQFEEQLYLLCCIPWGTRMVDAPNPAREPRDLPKAWSRFVEEVLARDLDLALIGRDSIVSRDEHQRSRITRFTYGGEAVTDIRLV